MDLTDHRDVDWDQNAWQLMSGCQGCIHWHFQMQVFAIIVAHVVCN